MNAPDPPSRVLIRREHFERRRQPWIDSATAGCVATDDDTGAVVGRWHYGGVAIVRPSTGAGVFVGVRDWLGPNPRLVWALAHPRRWLAALWRRRFGDGTRTLVVDTRQAQSDTAQASSEAAAYMQGARCANCGRHWTLPGCVTVDGLGDDESARVHPDIRC